MRKKRPVVLLELLIAGALVALLSVYLIRNPMYQLKNEIDTLVDLEVERLWLVQLMRWREELPEDWGKYPDKKPKEKWEALSLPIRISSSDLKIPLIQRKVVVKYRRWQEVKKIGTDGAQHFRMRYQRKKEDKKNSNKDLVYDLYFKGPALS